MGVMVYMYQLVGKVFLLVARCIHHSVERVPCAKRCDKILRLRATCGLPDVNLCHYSQQLPVVYSVVWGTRCKGVRSSTCDIVSVWE